jgi:hypothetical protein
MDLLTQVFYAVSHPRELTLDKETISNNFIKKVFIEVSVRRVSTD